MDTISGVIVAIFVLTIVGSVTKLPDPNVNVSVEKEPVASTQTNPREIPVTGLSGEEGEHAFKGGYDENTQSNIYNFIKKKAKTVKDNAAQMMAENIIKYSQQYDVNPKILTALIAAESKFNSQAVSRSGAQGLGQLLPSTARHLGVNDPFNIEENIMGTTRYFRSMLDRFKGYDPRVHFALAGYKEGPNAVLKRGYYKSDSQSYIDLIMKYYSDI
ncbi:MAG: lytic transglycosylase domain-containing protein [Candidatus Margulisiibacteriota bacterium]|nr:lytic transglycosylase domain-containing protein [Candidatus Margulisiibacteriota bacterium]